MPATCWLARPGWWSPPTRLCASSGHSVPGRLRSCQRAFHLSDAQRQGLEGAHRGEFLLAAGHRRLEIQVAAEPWQEEIMKASVQADPK